jgi:hypothetical protein
MERGGVLGTLLLQSVSVEEALIRLGGPSAEEENHGCS